MKKLMHFIFMAISISAYSNSNSFIYHCPFVDDLIYERGSFTAKTNYGVPVSWYSVRGFPEKRLTANFFRVNRNSCLGGVCQVGCAYQLSNGDKVFLFISRDQYESEETAPGNWESDGSTCIDSNPDNCKFYLNENHL